MICSVYSFLYRYDFNPITRAIVLTNSVQISAATALQSRLHIDGRSSNAVDFEPEVDSLGTIDGFEQRGRKATVVTVTTEAQLAAALTAGSDIVLGADIALTSTIVIISTTVSLDGNGFTLSGQNAVSCVRIESSTVTIVDVTMTAGYASGPNYGGALRITDSAVTMFGSRLTSSYAFGGGGLYLTGSTSSLTLTDCSIERNSAVTAAGLLIDSANQV